MTTPSPKPAPRQYKYYDLVMAAFNEAAKKVDEEAQGKAAGMLGGLDLPGLG